MRIAEIRGALSRELCDTFTCPMSCVTHDKMSRITDRSANPRSSARAHTHTRRNLSRSFLSLFFLFIYLLLIPITHLHISPTDPAVYRSRLPVSNRTCAHIHAGVFARTHIHTRNIISVRDDPTFLRLHVGLRMPSVRNTSVQCHVINRTNRCRTDPGTYTHFIADSSLALFTTFNTTVPLLFTLKSIISWEYNEKILIKLPILE